MSSDSDNYDDPIIIEPDIDPDSIQRLREVAIHEAGHAVAAWAVHRQIKGLATCYPFYRIVVRTIEECEVGPYVDDKGHEHCILGMVERSAFYRAYGPAFVKHIAAHGPRTLKRVRARMEGDVVVSLAGPIAQARVCRCSDVKCLLDPGNDMECAWDKLSDFATSPARAGAMMIGLVRRARRLVRLHWPRIEVLADALVERREMEFEDAIPIIESATTKDVDSAAPLCGGRLT